MTVHRKLRPTPLSHKSCKGAFTIIELLIVMTIILVLGGLILATAGYVQKKGARSRTEAEIAALSAALESYKADNGEYPRDPTSTDTVDARAPYDGTRYQAASLFLYEKLSATNPDHSVIPNAKSYFAFKPNMLSPRDQSLNTTAIVDPFGNSYGYSTARAANPTGNPGYNPTFDLWSTGGVTTGNDQSQWIKNW